MQARQRHQEASTPAWVVLVAIMEGRNTKTKDAFMQFAKAKGQAVLETIGVISRVLRAENLDCTNRTKRNTITAIPGSSRQPQAT